MNQSKPEQMEPRFANGAMEGYAYDAHKFLDELLAFPGVQAVAVAAGGAEEGDSAKTARDATTTGRATGSKG